MAYIDIRRKDYIRNLILKIGGPYLTNHQIYFARNPKAGNSIATQSDRVIMLSIRNDYAHGPIDMLIALVIHEFANTQTDLHLSRLDRCEMWLVSRIGLSRRKNIFSRGLAKVPHYVVRTLFEGPLFGWKRILSYKLRVDRHAVDLILLHGLPVGGYEKFLQKELQDRNNFLFPRRIWHQFIARKRIEKARKYIYGIS